MEAKNELLAGIEMTFASWILRVWLGMRALLTGIEKYGAVVNVEKPLLDEAGNPDPSGIMLSVEQKVYGLSHYHGMPESLSEKFMAEPFLPGWALSIYQAVLGPVLILLGITVLLGVLPRISYFAMGLLYCSLTLGLILIGQDGGIAWLGTHIIMIVAALALSKHNKLAIFNKF
jgi:thiosulfate dehydrogenase [quinone] large subunit